MFGIILRVIAFIFFCVAGFGETLFRQGPADLVAWGLAAWVLSTLLDGYFGPWQRGT